MSDYMVDTLRFINQAKVVAVFRLHLVPEQEHPFNPLALLKEHPLVDIVGKAYGAFESSGVMGTKRLSIPARRVSRSRSLIVPVMSQNTYSSVLSASVSFVAKVRPSAGEHL